MAVRLKRLADQVVVITGATSGIGLVTARAAARQGARLVLAARNEDALKDVADSIRVQGGQATWVVADVGDEVDVRRIADAALDHYGGFDTWVNNAGVTIYGRVEDVTLEDHRRLFETNYWGLVHGSRVATAHLRGRGGALINVGSVLSDRIIPLQGTYGASKHAVKAFTDALRMELEEDGAPVSVTLIKPSAIDTPYVVHARNYLPRAPRNAPPAYAPETVADAILRCAQRPARDVVVGGGGRAITAVGNVAPRLTDRLMARTMSSLQQTNRPAPHDGSNLHRPGRGGAERSGYDIFVLERSLYTRAALHPLLTAGVALGVGLAALGAWRLIANGRGACASRGAASRGAGALERVFAGR